MVICKRKQKFILQKILTLDYKKKKQTKTTNHETESMMKTAKYGKKMRRLTVTIFLLVCDWHEWMIGSNLLNGAQEHAVLLK